MTLNSYIHLKAPVNSLRIVAALLLLTACGHSGNTNNTSPDNAAAVHVIDTVQVFLLKPDTAKKSVELSGELIPHLQTDIFAKIPGYVKEMKADIGDRVHKGQIIAIIEAPEVNTQLAQSKATSLSARSRLTASTDKYQRLYRAAQSSSPGIVAPVDLVASHDQMMADSAAYEALRQQSKAYKEISGYLYVTAPFDGVIISRKTDPGALVSASSMLVTIQDNNTLRLRISVPEAYTAATGRRDLSFSVNAYPQQSFTGILTRKTETIDPLTRTELWEYHIDNARHLLKAGAFVYARLSLGRSSPSFIVPPSAIATTLERKFVIQIRQGRTEYVNVRQGMTTEAGIEIFGNFKTGDTLVLKASDERKPGTTAYWRNAH